MTASFADHVGLLHHFLDRRAEIAETIEGTLLNVRSKETSRIRDRKYFEQRLHACFFGLPGLPRDLARLKGQLAARHLADGFEPVLLDKYSHELDPLELIVRAYEHWERHRWPGKSGRMSFAGSVYAVFLLRHLEQLCLRVWDDGNDAAEDRLHDVQRLLDRLNAAPIPGAFVRDARWLLQTAQGPLTRLLQPYFTIAEHISGSFAESSRLGLHKAAARLTGGHLRSQLRYRAWSTGGPIDDPENLAITRNSNSMDTALLVRDLVSLLSAYERARQERDVEARLDLADAILQGVSADAELFLTRLDLLAPCTMIEELFVERGEDGQARYTPLGQSHLSLLRDYGVLIGRLAAALREDAMTFDPAARVYSPFGIVYGFCADMLSNMAVATLLSQPSFGLSLEDTFVSRGSLDEKLTRARGWAALPRREGEREHFDHSVEFATQVFAGLMGALDARATHPTRPNASGRHDARLFVVPRSDVHAHPDAALAPGIVRADDYRLTTDMKRALSGGTYRSVTEMQTDRQEGRFLASIETGGTWIGISKVLLTLVTSQGKDALMTDVPPAVVEVMHLTCPGLIVSED
jgi:hypothetical protein